MFRSVQPNRYTIVQRMYSFEFVYLLCYTSKIHNNHNKSTVLHACLDRVHCALAYTVEVAMVVANSECFCLNLNFKIQKWNLKRDRFSQKLF